MTEPPVRIWDWQRFAGRAFGIAALAALLVTPLQAGFALRPFACEFTSSLDLWATGLANVRHLLAFGILAVLAVGAFRDRPLYVAIGLVLFVTIGVELEQALFADGHCRVRDMLPNLIAVAVGTGIALVAERSIPALRRRG